MAVPSLLLVISLHFYFVTEVSFIHSVIIDNAITRLPQVIGWYCIS